jgi:hypothetical protein
MPILGRARVFSTMKCVIQMSWTTMSGHAVCPANGTWAVPPFRSVDFLTGSRIQAGRAPITIKI